MQAGDGTSSVSAIRSWLSSPWVTSEASPSTASQDHSGDKGSASTSRGSTPSSESPECAATGGAATESLSQPAAEQRTTPPEEPLKMARHSSTMRRNYTASDALSHHGTPAMPTEESDDSMSPGMRRNTSAATLCELRRREHLAMAKKDTRLDGSRAAVVEAVACRMLEHILGTDAALAAMRVALAKAAADGAPGGPGDLHALNGRKPGLGLVAEAEAAGGSSSTSLAEDEAKLAELGVPAGISQSLQGYILTIVRHLELPNSCIVASLIYVQRAVSGTRFSLSVTNWQPCLLAAFVVAAKLSFDEPVWNEDFVKALRISNVQVCQISRWEADFLQLLSFNTNVTVAQYASCCFSLQSAHTALHGRPCRFFTYLMALSGGTNGAGAAE